MTVIAKVNRDEVITGDWTFNGEVDLGEAVILAQSEVNDFTAGVTMSSNLTFADTKAIVFNTGTGSKIGTAVGQKIGFWNVTPVIQQASANQGALGSVTTAGSNVTASGAGLSLIGDTTSVNQAAALMADLKALQEDMSALFTLVAALRTALVATGIVKGGA